MRKLIFQTLLLLFFALPASPGYATSLEEDRHAAVILAYYGVGDDDYAADTNLPLEQFLAHVREIKEGGYRVISLPALIDAFETGEEIPEHTLVITFQGAHSSALQNAVPVLLKEKMPFTIFYSSTQTETSSNNGLNWDNLRALARNQNVTLGIMPDFHHQPENSNLEDIKRQINNAILKYRQNFNTDPIFFSYPYGEYSKNLKAIVKNSGFRAALGLQSGAAYAGGDLYALPRFTMSGEYGDLERFRLVTGALPFPVYDVEPADSYIQASAPIGFSVPESLQKNLSDLSCFISGENKPSVEIIGTRVELRGYQAPQGERARINCTLPSGLASDQGPRWRWFGMLLAGPG